jgi:hypothetical protein
MRITRPTLTTATLAAALTMAVSDGGLAADAPHWDVNLWPGGRVPYRFADASDGVEADALMNTPAERQAVRDQMDRWEGELLVQDPANRTRWIRYIQFVPCEDRCENEDSYVLFRFNRTGETNQMCTYLDRDNKERVGRNPAENGITTFHVYATAGANDVRHELGHCLGLWHEFNRGDADAWLNEVPDADGLVFRNRFNTRAALMPPLGNYDYDSIMHYRSYGDVDGDGDNELRWTDALGNTFDRLKLHGVSPRDVSRLLQYYAYEAHPNWAFFESLAAPAADPDVRPDPLLAPGVEPVGTPAIANQSPGNFDVFVRGTDNRIYWKSFRRRWLPFEPSPIEDVGAWASLGCCFGSDPSAISRGDGQIDVVAIGAVTGRPSRKRFAGGAWGQWVYVRDGVPAGGIKQAADQSYLGPAIAARTADSLDVFVVLASGTLAVTTLQNGSWTNWATLETAFAYDVSARPAALALSSASVRLAINGNGGMLYEPLVRFAAVTAAAEMTLGNSTGWVQPGSAPALTARADAASPYRVLAVTTRGRVAHRFAGGGWRDIGGIPKSETGLSAVASGASSALIVMNGEDAVACRSTCDANQPLSGRRIQTGGVWLRRFH